MSSSTTKLAAVAALLASTTLANPFKPILYRRDPEGCPPTSDPSQPYVATVGYFSDDACNTQIGADCAHVGAAADGPGAYGCLDPSPPDAPLYAKIIDTAYPDVQFVFTADQSCPPNGPGAVFATLIDNGACVKLNKGGDQPGLTVYPNGGSDIAKRVVKRDPSCSGFRIDSQQASESNTVQISAIVDCTNSADAGCTITTGEQHTESVSTSYSFSAGGGVEGVFEVSTTFGMEYTDSTTTEIQEGFTVDPGQKGYLSSYCAATLFKGAFTGCDSGDAEQPGQALVLKSNGLTYEVVYTG